MILFKIILVSVFILSAKTVSLHFDSGIKTDYWKEPLSTYLNESLTAHKNYIPIKVVNRENLNLRLKEHSLNSSTSADEVDLKIMESDYLLKIEVLSDDNPEKVLINTELIEVLSGNQLYNAIHIAQELKFGYQIRYAIESDVFCHTEWNEDNLLFIASMMALDTHSKIRDIRIEIVNKISLNFDNSISENSFSQANLNGTIQTHTIKYKKDHFSNIFRVILFADSKKSRKFISCRV